MDSASPSTPDLLVLPTMSKWTFLTSSHSRWLHRLFSSRAHFRLKNDHINNLLETDRKWSISFILSSPSEVYIHSTEEVLGYDTRAQFLYEENYSVDLLISMKQTYTTEDTKQLSITQRKCLYQGEVDLTYYKNDIYSLSACVKQCRMQRAFQRCKCIPPFYKPATGSFKQCTLSDFKCLTEQRESITDIGGCRHCGLSCLNTVFEAEKYTKT